MIVHYFMHCCVEREIVMVKKWERGSATIEATIGLTAFIFFMMMFIMIVKCVMVQTIMQNALSQTAKEVSQNVYLYKAFGLVSVKQELSSANSAVTKSVSDTKNNLQSIMSAFTEDVDLVNLEDDLSGRFAVIQTNVGEIGDNVETAANNIVAGSIYQLVDAAEKKVCQNSFKKYVTPDGNSADSYLKKLSIVDGIEGLDFSDSSIMSGKSNAGGDSGDGTSDTGESGTEVEASMNEEAAGSGEEKKASSNVNANESINLVVRYKIRIFHPVKGWMDTTCVQAASTRGWLGDGNRGKTLDKD